MVTFLFFTVSILAVHINAVSTNELNHDPCEGKTLCFEKPADYPQEDEMNHIVAKSDLRHLYRVKRDLQAAFKDSKETNECIENIEDPAPIYVASVEGAARTVVQSSSLKQLVAKITCKTNKTCFENVKVKRRFECEEVTTRVYMMMYKKGDVGASPMPTDMVTGCRCEPRD